jgi:hypothetical protein
MKRGAREITYLDADLMFFADPKIVFDEIAKREIAIVPHRFAEKDRARLEPNGLYNVSWVTFRNSNRGGRCLQNWARQCREWCKYANEGGRFGDQKYLDDWPLLFPEACCVIQNIGVGVAPWNIAEYAIDRHDGTLYVTTRDGQTMTLVFYHFHEWKDNHDGTYRLTNWPLRDSDRELIYAPYIRAIERARSATRTETVVMR